MNVSAENYYQSNAPICEPQWYAYGCDYSYVMHEHFPGTIFILLGDSLFDMNGFRVVICKTSSYMDYSQPIIIHQLCREKMASIMTGIRKEQERTTAFAKSYEAQQEKRREENFRSKKLEAKRAAEAEQARLVALAETERITLEAAKVKRARKLRVLLAIRLELLRRTRTQNELSRGFYDLLRSFDSEEKVSSFFGTFSMSDSNERQLVSMFNIIFGSIPFLVKTLKTHEPGKIHESESARNQWFKFLGMTDEVTTIVSKFFYLLCIELRSVNSFEATEAELIKFVARIAQDSVTILHGSYRKTPGNGIQALMNWAKVLCNDLFSKNGLLLATGLPEQRPLAWQGLEQSRNKSTLDAIMAQKFRELPTGKKLEDAKTQVCTQYKTAFNAFPVWTNQKVNSSHPLVNALAIVYSRLSAPIEEIIHSQLENGTDCGAIVQILDKAIADAIRQEW